MSESENMIAEMANRLLANIARGEDETSLPQQAEELGFNLLLLPEEAGGIGGSWEDLFFICQALGRHAVAYPLAEEILIRAIRHHAGYAGPVELTTLAFSLGQIDDQSNRGVTGAFDTLGAVAEESVLLCGIAGQVHFLQVSQGKTEQWRSIDNGERARVIFHESRPMHSCLAHSGEINDCLALIRAGQMAGAMEAALVRTIEYVKDRNQFGRKLSEFQAVQQQLSVAAEEVAVVACAAHAAAVAADGGKWGFPQAAAKLRANLGVDRLTPIVHQLHGAIGITREYPLHRSTQRLWQWRSDAGNDRYWSKMIGHRVVAGGHGGLLDIIAE
jgi:acyl-CoA dehydrogenase